MLTMGWAWMMKWGFSGEVCRSPTKDLRAIEAIFLLFGKLKLKWKYKRKKMKKKKKIFGGYGLGYEGLMAVGFRY